jgi:hypothetical protein
MLYSRGYNSSTADIQNKLFNALAEDTSAGRLISNADYSRFSRGYYSRKADIKCRLFML